MIRFLPLALVACTFARGEADRAVLCLGETPEASEEGSALEINAGEALQLSVQDGMGCHTEDLEVSCIAEVVDDEIFVTTETTWTRVQPLATSCEAVLFTAVGSCATSAPLEEGTYTVHYGDQSLVIEVPGTADETCIFP
jgi:hypothetical protein